MVNLFWKLARNCRRHVKAKVADKAGIMMSRDVTPLFAFKADESILTNLVDITDSHTMSRRTMDKMAIPMDKLV